VQLSEDRYQDLFTIRAKKKALASLDEVDPEILKTYEKLGIPCAKSRCWKA